MASKAEIKTMITHMENQLKETKDAAEMSRGFVNDTLRIVVPMLEDQLKIMRAMMTADEG